MSIDRVLQIARFAKELEAERVLCESPLHLVEWKALDIPAGLTATATKGVQDDICQAFDIDLEHGVFRTPVFRPKSAHLSPI
jgi:hypothetical protein